jgi:ADP-ribose pyrophosphatase YjhB (NUDIX family)
MRRRKPGRDYCILPGGGVELDETFEQACLREVKEETGLDVLGLRQARVYYRENEQEVYYVAQVASGEPQLGGVEAQRHSEANHYSFEWALVEELEAKNLLPVAARRICREVMETQVLP